MSTMTREKMRYQRLAIVQDYLTSQQTSDDFYFMIERALVFLETADRVELALIEEESR